MSHLTPIQPLADLVPGPRLLKSELADRMRAAYIEVGCPACSHPGAVQVSHLKDVTRAQVTCGGCGAPFRRDEAVSLTLMSAIGRHTR